MSIIRLKDTIYTDLLREYDEGSKPFYYTGFEALAEHYAVGLGHTTYVTGIPSHGKSTFVFETLINLTMLHGFKHVIFTPETGSPTRIAKELLQMKTMKHFDKFWQHNRMTKTDIDATLPWIDDNFIVINDGLYEVTDMTRMFLEARDKSSNKTAKFTFLIDPWNELNHDFAAFSGREDKYLENKLGYLRRFAREQNIHLFVVAHPSKMQKQREVVGGESIQFYDPPTAYDLSGGGAWYAKGETILSVYIPPAHIKTRDEEVNIIIHKAKPREAGKKGMVKLYFNTAKYRYFELNSGGEPEYANQLRTIRNQNNVQIQAKYGEDPF